MLQNKRDDYVTPITTTTHFGPAGTHRMNFHTSPPLPEATEGICVGHDCDPFVSLLVARSTDRVKIQGLRTTMHRGSNSFDMYKVLGTDVYLG